MTSFEPMRGTFQVLRENVFLNGLTNADVQPSAVADHCGSTKLPTAADQELGWRPIITGNSVEGIPRSLTVPVMTLDRFAENLGRSPSVIKIDGEGGELAVLTGACRTLAVVRQGSHRRARLGHASQELIRFLLQHGHTSTIQWTHGREAFDLGFVKNRHVIETCRKS
jgi:FkbM family methyltransferase